MNKITLSCGNIINQGGRKMATLGQLVKRARENAGLTQKQLGDAIGVSRDYIASIENERVELPSREVIRKLARVLPLTREQIVAAAGYIGQPSEEDTEVLATKRMLEKMQNLLTEYGTILSISGDQAIDVAGRVPAGFPAIPEAEAVEQLVISKRWFALRVTGDSLCEIGIESGDLVFIDPADVNPQPGQITVVQFADGSVTMKRWYPQNDHVRLATASPSAGCAAVVRQPAHPTTAPPQPANAKSAPCPL
jgi:repressor LexA